MLSASGCRERDDCQSSATFLSPFHLTQDSSPRDSAVNIQGGFLAQPIPPGQDFMDPELGLLGESMSSQLTVKRNHTVAGNILGCWVSSEAVLLAMVSACISPVKS